MSKVDHEIIIKLFGCIHNSLVNFEFEKEDKSKKKWQEKWVAKILMESCLMESRIGNLEVNTVTLPLLSECGNTEEEG